MFLYKMSSLNNVNMFILSPSKQYSFTVTNFIRGGDHFQGAQGTGVNKVGGGGEGVAEVRGASLTEL